MYTYRNQTFKIVAHTPAGRRRHLKILSRYILQSSVIDQWDLWVNTNVPEDIEYMRQLQQDNPQKVCLYELDGIDGVSNDNIHRFWKFIEPSPTILYIRFDDDICFVDEAAIENLVTVALEHLTISNLDGTPVYSFVSANTVINNVCDRLRSQTQNNEILDATDVRAVDHQSVWNVPELAEAGHRNLLEAIHSNTVYRTFYLRDRFVPLKNLEEIQINCIAFLGVVGAHIASAIGVDEERFVMRDYLIWTGSAAGVVGNAVVAHYAYHPTRHYLDTQTNILDKYLTVSMDTKASRLCDTAETVQPKVTDTSKTLDLIIPHKATPTTTLSLATAILIAKETAVKPARVGIIIPPDFSNVYVNWNYASYMSKADALVFINDDMYMAPGWDEVILEYIEDNVILTGYLIEPGVLPVSELCTEADFGRTPDTFDRNAFEAAVEESKHNLCEVVENEHGWYIPCALTPKTLHDLGDWGIIGNRYHNDKDFFDKAKQAGIKFRKIKLFAYHLQALSARV